jgi:hypothetical protein
LGEALALADGNTGAEARCIVHTRQNVSKNSRTERKGNENQEQRKRLMEQAAAISHADNATQAQAHLACWTAQWREQAPHAVATLERDCAQTPGIRGLDLTWIRTTSL